MTLYGTATFDKARNTSIFKRLSFKQTHFRLLVKSNHDRSRHCFIFSTALQPGTPVVQISMSNACYRRVCSHLRDIARQICRLTWNCTSLSPKPPVFTTDDILLCYNLRRLGVVSKCYKSRLSISALACHATYGLVSTNSVA